MKNKREAPMKLKSHISENFMGLVHAEMEFDQNNATTIVCGYNENGKSSFLDSLFCNLGGEGMTPKMTIREGQSSAFSETKADDIIIRRDWKRREDGTIQRKLSVRYEDGRKAGGTSEQTFLNNLFGAGKANAFDPGKFLSAKPPEQRKMLLELLGIEDELVKIEDEYERVFNIRTGITGQLTDQKGAVKVITIPGNDIPTEPYSVKDMAEQVRKATQANESNNTKRFEFDRSTKRFNEISEEIKVFKARIKALDTEQYRESEVLDSLESIIPNLKDIDTAPILEKISGVEEQNRIINEANRQRELRTNAVKRRDDLQKSHDDRTKELEGINYQKVTILKNANFPIEGLSVDDNGVVINGIPFDQGSTSKRIVTSIMIAIEKLPENGFRIVRVKDASLFDEATLIKIAEIGIEHKVRFVLERVGIHDRGGRIMQNGFYVMDVPLDDDPYFEFLKNPAKYIEENKVIQSAT